MNSTVVLYAGRLAPAVYEPLPDGRDSLAAAVSRARAFPGVSRVVLLATEDFAAPPSLADVAVERSARWGKRGPLPKFISAGTGVCFRPPGNHPGHGPELGAKTTMRRHSSGGQRRCKIWCTSPGE